MFESPSSPASLPQSSVCLAPRSCPCILAQRLCLFRSHQTRPRGWVVPAGLDCTGGTSQARQRLSKGVRCLWVQRVNAKASLSLGRLGTRCSTTSLLNRGQTIVTVSTSRCFPLTTIYCTAKHNCCEFCKDSYPSPCCFKDYIVFLNIFNQTMIWCIIPVAL